LTTPRMFNAHCAAACFASSWVHLIPRVPRPPQRRPSTATCPTHTAGAPRARRARSCRRDVETAERHAPFLQ
jgi:hypothetical protein